MFVPQQQRSKRPPPPEEQRGVERPSKRQRLAPPAGTTQDKAPPLTPTSVPRSQSYELTSTVSQSWSFPETDASIPQNSAAYAVYLRQLTDAFSDTTTCVDSKQDASFIAKWSGLTNFPTPAMIETTCRSLLSVAITLHRQGPNALHVFDASKMKNVHATRKLSFAERIESVCELLRLSKARCETLLGGDGLHMCAATPLILVRQTRGNKRQNGVRQEMLVKGRKRLAGESVEEDEDGE
ncbi:hypothetical protein BDW02DRAFT_492154 [Decorospora gaudefroyi]|uniref:Uncharacterized protein n=1 Tax=Decorospora gaudefroyi TaxID=184978 RepID=A0A6A5KMT7_9PLEO|nr:hypothetical protein BDW02DRAFT_492154 [Decorospora gaudefroyi]